LGAAFAVKARYPEFFEGLEGAFLLDAAGLFHELSNTVVVEEGSGNGEEREDSVCWTHPWSYFHQTSCEASVAIAASLDVLVLTWWSLAPCR
jgi:hypothetical protein